MRRQHEQDASLYDPLSKIKRTSTNEQKRKSAKIRPAHSSGSPDPCSLPQYEWQGPACWQHLINPEKKQTKKNSVQQQKDSL